MNVRIKREGSPIKPSFSFHYGDDLIVVERAERLHASGKVLIKVHPDCRVVALAPQETDNAVVLEAVKKRSRWIYEQLRAFRKQREHHAPRKYVSGESHYYLGKQYLLKVIETSETPQCVKLLRGKLEVTLRERSAEKTQQLMNSWYKSKAKETFAKRLDAMLEQTLWVKERPAVRIRTMQTQWGSCSPNGRITLNPQLVKVPRDCIDYVILHELCHIAEHNHSERFYRLMNQVMPNWESIKDRLDNMAAKINPL